MSQRCARRLSKIVLLILVFSVNTSLIFLAHADTWEEVDRWSGEAFPDVDELSTEPFFCSAPEWRIRWSYIATGSPFESILLIKVYEQGNPEEIDLVFKMSYYSQNGVNSIHNNDGTFYLNITAANIEEYLIIV